MNGTETISLVPIIVTSETYTLPDGTSHPLFIDMSINSSNSWSFMLTEIIGDAVNYAVASAVAEILKNGLNPEGDKACQALRQNTEKTKGALPDYVTGNKNWNDVATLTGYRNLYQSSYESYSAANSSGVQGAIAVAGFVCGIWGPCRVLEVGGAATAGVFLSDTSLNELENSTKAAVDALDARVQQLNAEC